MSAFFVEANTVADAVACLREAGTVPKHPNHELTDKELGTLLYMINAEALVQRYDDDPDKYLDDINGYNEPAASDDKWQRLKSLHCLIYQCSEGTVPENALYKLMTAADAVLTAKLGVKDVYGVKEYNAAEWGRK